MKDGHYFGDPDDAQHSKALALVKYAEWMKRMLTDGGYHATSAGLEGITSDPNLEIFW